MKKKRLVLHRETLRRLDLKTVSGGTMMFACNFSDGCPSESCNVSCGDTCSEWPNCNESTKCGGTVQV